MKPQIKQIIVMKNLKQKDIAEKIGVTSQQLSNWINEVSYPRLEKAFELAKVLEVKVDDLWIYEQ